MRILIVGNGVVGRSLAERLAAEDHDVVLIDQNAAPLDDVQKLLDIQTIAGDAVEEGVLRRARAAGADLLIAVTDRDSVNLLVCMVARRLGTAHTIARIREPHYAGSLALLRDELALSMTIHPESSAANEIARVLRFPCADNIDAFAGGRAELLQFRLEAGGLLCDRTLAEVRRRVEGDVVFCAVERQGGVYVPKGDFILRAGDTVTLTSSPAQASRFFRAAGLAGPRCRDILIVGGGRITPFLVRQLTANGSRVRIIEPDAARCRELSELFPKAEVACGDGMDRALLREMDMSHMDAVVALTGSDERNAMLALVARQSGVGKVAVKLDSRLYLPVLQEAGIASIVLPKALTADRIGAYVCAMQNSRGCTMEALYRLAGGRIEAMEFHLRDADGPGDILDVPLKDLPLRPAVVIATIVRDNTVILPGGGDALRRGDTVVLFAPTGQVKRFGDICH